jgi:hypothetical protein
MTKHKIDIDRAIIDEKLLGAALGDPQPWQMWRTVAKSAFGIALNEEEASEHSHPPFLDLSWRKGSFIMNLPLWCRYSSTSSVLMRQCEILHTRISPQLLS